MTQEALLVQVGLDGVAREPGDLTGDLGGAEVQELAGVVPVVDGLRGVDALVALEADQRSPGPGAEHLGDLGLADTGLTFEQQRPSHRDGEEDRCRQALVGQVAVGPQGSGDGIDVGGSSVRGSGRRGSSAMAPRLVPLRWPAVPDLLVRVHAPDARAVYLVVFDGEGDTEVGAPAVAPARRRLGGQRARGNRVRAGGRRDRAARRWVEGAARPVRTRGPLPATLLARRRRGAWRSQQRAGPARRRPCSPHRAGPGAVACAHSSCTRPTSAGSTLRRGGRAAGTYLGLADDLDRLAALGVTVIELMPVHQNDPEEGSYWGYMPLAFGALHRQYAATADAWRELGDLVATAHERDIEVWLDVVYNHTTEVDAAGPTYHLRGLADGEYYRLNPDGSYIETTGCGHDFDTSSPAARTLIIETLDRLADLGVDGLRFDLAPVVVRHRPFVAELDAWAARRGVRMIAEPWDAAGTHELGTAWPGRGWLQWNDRFRDDVRGYLRAEAGLVPVLMQRVQGSPDLFDAPMHSVNFLSCHDGFTLYDLVAYDRKHNEANGHRNRDGASENRSWNCGWEGDLDAPEEVLALRQRQLRNAWCLLAMSHGVPMVAMGDEFGRTQGGNNNAYNQDNETSWVDWERRARFADLERFVGELLALRARHDVFARQEWWGDAIAFYGANGEVDTASASRSLAWCVGDLYVVTNTWWEAVPFWIQAPGPWTKVVDTSLAPPHDIIAASGDAPGDDVLDAGSLITVEARSVVILERRRSR